MNESLILKAIPWGVALICVLGTYTAGCLYLSERDDFAAFRAKVEQAAKDATEREARKEALYDLNLKIVKEQYEAGIARIRNDSVAAYKLRYPATTDSSRVCPVAQSVSVDDGARKELLADRKFIADCGDDAAKLTAWQEFCKRNNCPIEE